MKAVLPTDEELLQAVRQNDRKAFDMLYGKYWAIVYKKAFSYLKDQDASAEIVNDIFLNIWLRRNELHIITFENYLTAAARYRVYNSLKTLKRNSISYIESYDDIPGVSIDNNAGEINIHTYEIHQQINHLLNQLPKRCKEIFLLSRISQLTNTEIASKLSISKRTVENQLSLAVKYLKSHFGLLAVLQCILSCIRK